MLEYAIPSSGRGNGNVFEGLPAFCKVTAGSGRRKTQTSESKPASSAKANCPNQTRRLTLENPVVAGP